MHVMVLTYGEPKKGYLNFTLGNLWATQPMALLIWPPLKEESLNLGTGTFWCIYCNNISARLFNYYTLSRTLILKHLIYA